MAGAGGMPQLSQRLGFDLPDAFARDVELLADFFQRMLASTFEAEVQSKHLCVTRGQRSQGLLDFIGAEHRRNPKPQQNAHGDVDKQNREKARWADAEFVKRAERITCTRGVSMCVARAHSRLSAPLPRRQCVIFWRKSDDWMALLVALGVVALGTLYVTFSLQGNPSAWQVLAIVLNGLGNGVFFLVCSLFPTGRFVPRWTRWLLPCWVVSGMLFLFFREVSFLYLVYNVVWLGEVVLLVTALFYRYRYASSPLQRQQTKWVIYGGSVAGLIVVGLTVPLYLFPSLGQAGSFYQLVIAPAYILAVLIVPLSTGLAILRYRLYDIDLLINRTLVYGLLTVLLALIYCGCVILLQDLVRGLTGQVGQ